MFISLLSIYKRFRQKKNQAVTVQKVGMEGNIFARIFKYHPKHRL